MKIGRTKFIKWQVIKKLIEITRTSEEKVEQHILAIKSGDSGKITEVKFPIKKSPELALLVAKGMGDGTIEKNTLRFSFWNKEEELIEEVCDCVNKAIGKTKGTIIKFSDGRIQVKFPPFIGFVLHKAGVPIGNKTLQEFDVPNWIKNGSKEIKASFIRGLFDDEACIKMKSEKSRSREIILAQGKSIELEESLKKFFDSIKAMLLELKIKSGNITRQQILVDKNGKKKVILRFAIGGKENLERFLKEVGFTSLRKTERLKKTLESFVDIHKNRRKILKVLMENKKISAQKISKLTNINQKLVWVHLIRLAKENLIAKDNSKRPTLWFLNSSLGRQELK